MKRMRILGLALVAVFAFAGLTAAGASASPHWYECKKEAGGKYEKGCAAEGGKAGYVLVEGIGKGTFKGKGGTAVLHNVIPGKGDIKVECASFKDSGKIALPDLNFGVTAEFKKCKSLGAPCQNEGGKKETIKTNLMSGKLGWLNKAGKSAGASLTSEAEPNTGYLAEFECTGLAKVRVFGAVIGEQLGDVEVISKNTEAKYTVGEYLGEPKPGYKPLTNQPAFEEGLVGWLKTELNGPETGNTWQPPGGLPSGQEGVAKNKGSALMIK